MLDVSEAVDERRAASATLLHPECGIGTAEELRLAYACIECMASTGSLPVNAYARIYQTHASESALSMLQAIPMGWTTCQPMHPMMWEQQGDWLKLLHE